MNDLQIRGDKEIDDSRREQTPQKLFVHDVLKVIPATIFAFQLTGERTTAMPYVSDRFLSMTGLHPEEVAENAAPLLARIHPDDIGQFFTSVEESAKTMAPWYLEFRIDHPEKNVVWVEWQATPVRQDGILFWHGTLLDITQRKARQ
jgi:PAS domain S-box-containing protein